MQEKSGFVRIDEDMDELRQEIAKLSGMMIVLVEVIGDSVTVTRGNGDVMSYPLPPQSGSPS